MSCSVRTASPWRASIALPAVRPHLPAALGIVALVLFLFRDAVFGGRVFYHRDLHLQWYGQALAFVRSIAAGSWPVWNPWVGFGQPLWANPNNQVLYPFTWLHLLMQPWTYYTCFVVAHALFSAAGAYALGLRVGLSRGGAGIFAATWAASGPFLSLVDLWNHLAAAAWIPWIFLAGEAALASGRTTAALAWGVTLAMPILAGSPETALLAGVAVAAYALRRADPRALAGTANRRLVLAAAVALAFGVAVSTAQWWPSLELLRHSPRLSAPAGGRSFWSIHPVLMLQAFLPFFPDRLPLSGEVRAAYSESREAYLRSLYLGASSFGLVLAGAAGRRRGLWLFFLGVAVAGVLLALGRYTPVYSIAATVLPPLGAVRFPAKAMVLTAFAWAAMAGIGFDAWRGEEGGRIARAVSAAVLAAITAAAGVLAVVLRAGAEEWGSAVLFRATSPRSYTDILGPTAWAFALAAAFAGLMLALVLRRGGRARPGRTAVLAGAVLLADLVSVHDRLNPTAARELFTYRPAALDVVRPAPFQRVYVYDYFEAGKAPLYLGHRSAYLTKTPQEDWPVPWLDALALRMALFPSVLGNWGREGAYDRDALDLYPPPLRLLTDALRQVEGTPLHTRLLRLGAVEYVVALHRQGLDDLALVAALPSLFAEPVLVFRVPEPRPRAYAVAGARFADGLRAEAQALADPSFDPARMIVLPAASRPPSHREGLGGADEPAAGEASLLELRPDRVRIQAELSAAGYVVLVDAHDPGWRATLDGREVEVLRANVAFRAVAAPAGRHVVEYVYRPRSITRGLMVSGAALLAALAVCIAETRRRPPRRSNAHNSPSRPLRGEG